jgi:hypothetical protein
MPLSIVDGPTIQLNESLSDGVDCSAGTIVRITVPQEFTPSNLTFQVSSDGNLYNDLFDSRGGEITVAAKPNTGIIVSEAWTKSINFIKFRSGSRDHPVKQTRDNCKFAIAVETEGSAPATASASRQQPQRDTGHKDREAGR